MVTGSPAWRPHATLTLVASWNIAGSPPAVQEPNDWPTSAFRSKGVAFQGQVVRPGSCGQLPGNGVRHGSERLPGVLRYGTAHHEVTGSADNRPYAEGEGPAEQRSALTFEQVLQEGVLDLLPHTPESWDRGLGQHVPPDVGGLGAAGRLAAERSEQGGPFLTKHDGHNHGAGL